MTEENIKFTHHTQTISVVTASLVNIFYMELKTLLKNKSKYELLRIE